MGSDETSNEGVPAWLSDYRPIEVDVATLAGFAKALQDEVDLNLRPHVPRIFDGLDPGRSPFSRCDGFLELEAAWYLYADSKARTMRLVQDYADATEELAQAARLLAASYRTSDQLAAVRLADVQQALTSAAGQADS